MRARARCWACLIGPILATMPARADTAVHYAPAENLERIDVAEIERARVTLDMAAYVLTDRPVIEALIRAGLRGVRVRIYLDGEQSGRADMDVRHPFGRLIGTLHVEIRNKRPAAPLMHLKSYCVDGSRLRSGAANLSLAGLTHEDNDLILIDDSAACRAFTATFEQIWGGVDAE